MIYIFFKDYPCYNYVTQCTVAVTDQIYVVQINTYAGLHNSYFSRLICGTIVKSRLRYSVFINHFIPAVHMFAATPTVTVDCVDIIYHSRAYAL